MMGRRECDQVSIAASAKARMAAWIHGSFNVIEPSGIRFCPSFYRPFSKNSMHHVIVIVIAFVTLLRTNEIACLGSTSR